MTGTAVKSSQEGSVNKFKGLAAGLAVAVLVVPSAFADFRHSHETHGRDSSRSTERHDRGSSGSSTDRQNRSESRQNWNRGSSETRTFDRGRSENRGSENRSNDRSFNDRSFDRGRSNNRSFSDRSFDRGRSNDRSFDRGRAESSRGSFDRGRSSDRGRPFFHEGRVSRYERFGGGYRVWIIGAPYPFFIPEARFRLFPNFRVGLSIRLGGYYNPLGYYDYYDGPYDGSYYDGYGSPAYVNGDLSGIVESVDYRRGTVLIRDRASDRIVRVEMRGDDPRFGDLRIGDYVELSGDWTRIGTFQAYRVYNHDEAGYRYR
jgi:hypothetical protein